ncbi:uncharacterized protein CCR75_009803 [Bremia lactucae]|uniref:Uncharacterized protein n=1 Tax=Bremia lactucae TaxID=4779 RepID=A0A976FJW4_BRELC|nr:hypothetical protein CCR75_009803 [Bremia lactucae]
MTFVGNQSKAEKTCSYRFCILNERIHEEVLSFLGNQTLTKLQMMTGGHYQQCEPELAAYCCQCENDNPVAIHHSCRKCLGSYAYRLYVTRKTARQYGFTGELDEVIDSEINNCYENKWYKWSALESYMLQTFGSKMAWLRHIAMLNTRRDKVRYSRSLQREVGPEVAAIMKQATFRIRSSTELYECRARYFRIKAKMEERGFSFELISDSCKNYITDGIGSVEEVIQSVADTMT